MDFAQNISLMMSRLDYFFTREGDQEAYLKVKLDACSFHQPYLIEASFIDNDNVLSVVEVSHSNCARPLKMC